MTTHSRGKSAMGGGKKSKKSGKKPHSMHIRRGKSGGFIVEHRHQPDKDGNMEPMEEHVMPDMDALQSHVADAMGDQPEQAPPPSPDQGQAAQAPPAAQGM